jgi:hypothetical protein
MTLHELKLQAGIQDNPDQEGLDLFAELIVKECAGLVGHVIMEDGTRRSDFIRKHFGVEE